MEKFNSFDGQSYLNIETFRKSGVGVKTPVWFVKEGDRLYVRTVADSGKAKRVRNNGSVNVAPCKVDGTLLGDWTAATAHEVTDAKTAQQVDRLLSKKYGLMKVLFGLAGALQRRKETVLEIS